MKKLKQRELNDCLKTSICCLLDLNHNDLPCYYNWMVTNLGTIFRSDPEFEKKYFYGLLKAKNHINKDLKKYNKKLRITKKIPKQEHIKVILHSIYGGHAVVGKGKEIIHDPGANPIDSYDEYSNPVNFYVDDI